MSYNRRRPLAFSFITLPRPTHAHVVANADRTPPAAFLRLQPHHKLHSVLGLVVAPLDRVVGADEAARVAFSADIHRLCHILCPAMDQLVPVPLLLNSLCWLIWKKGVFPSTLSPSFSGITFTSGGRLPVDLAHVQTTFFGQRTNLSANGGGNGKLGLFLGCWVEGHPLGE
jgi:hypothetical protein